MFVSLWFCCCCGGFVVVVVVGGGGVLIVVVVVCFLIHAALFEYLHNPPNVCMDCRITNL